MQPHSFHKAGQRLPRSGWCTLPVGGGSEVRGSHSGGRGRSLVLNTSSSTPRNRPYKRQEAPMERCLSRPEPEDSKSALTRRTAVYTTAVRSPGFIGSAVSLYLTSTPPVHHARHPDFRCRHPRAPCPRCALSISSTSQLLADHNLAVVSALALPAPLGHIDSKVSQLQKRSPIGVLYAVGNWTQFVSTACQSTCNPVLNDISVRRLPVHQCSSRAQYRFLRLDMYRHLHEFCWSSGNHSAGDRL